MCQTKFWLWIGLAAAFTWNCFFGANTVHLSKSILHNRFTPQRSYGEVVDNPNTCFHSTTNFPNSQYKNQGRSCSMTALKIKPKPHGCNTSFSVSPPAPSTCLYSIIHGWQACQGKRCPTFPSPPLFLLYHVKWNWNQSSLGPIVTSFHCCSRNENLAGNPA